MTKRKILSQVACMYNPIGFAAAFIVRAKIQQKGFYSEDQFQIVKALRWFCLCTKGNVETQR